MALKEFQNIFSLSIEILHMICFKTIFVLLYNKKKLKCDPLKKSFGKFRNVVLN
jgi:hypothetical protein